MQPPPEQLALALLLVLIVGAGAAIAIALIAPAAAGPGDVVVSLTDINDVLAGCIRLTRETAQ